MNKECIKKIIQKYELKKQLPIIGLEELKKINIPKIEFLIDGILPSSGVSMISGDPGSYKTWLYDYMCYCFFKNKLFLGKHNIKSVNVLIINQDDPLCLTKDRIGNLFSSESGSFSKIHFWSGDFNMTSELILEKLKEFIELFEIGLVIFDTFRQIYNGDENNSGEISELFKNIKKLSGDRNVSFLLIHHNRKNDEIGNNIKSPIGSVAISGGLISSIHLKTMKDGIIEVSQGKSKAGEKFKKFYIKFDLNDKEDIFKVVDYKDKKSEEVIEIERFMLDYFKDNVDSQNTKTNIISNLLSINNDYSKKSLEEVLDNLIKNGNIKQVNESSQYNKKIYGLVS